MDVLQKKFIQELKNLQNQNLIIQENLCLIQYFYQTNENALESIAFSKYPKLKKIKSFLVNMKNPLFVRMTGSGSVIVAYFKSKKECEMAKIEFKRNFENYWCNTSKTL